MRIDIMVDIETLGNKADSTIFQVAAVAFNMETGGIYFEFNKIADIGVNKTNTITGDTLKWWLATDKELFHRLLHEGDGSSDDLLCAFRRWVDSLHLLSEDGNIVRGGHDLYLWGNGILFDNNLLKTQLEAIGEHYPIPFRNDRDVRTIVDLAARKLGITEKELKVRFEDPSLVAHDAYDDVRYQIALVRGCYRELI